MRRNYVELIQRDSFLIGLVVTINDKSVAPFWNVQGRIIKKYLIEKYEVYLNYDKRQETVFKNSIRFILLTGNKTTLNEKCLVDRQGVDLESFIKNDSFLLDMINGTDLPCNENRFDVSATRALQDSPEWEVLINRLIHDYGIVLNKSNRRVLNTAVVAMFVQRIARRE